MSPWHILANAGECTGQMSVIQVGCRPPPPHTHTSCSIYCIYASNKDPWTCIKSTQHQVPHLLITLACLYPKVHRETFNYAYYWDEAATRHKTKWAIVILLIEVCIWSQAVYCAGGAFGNRFMATTRTSWEHQEVPVTPLRASWNIPKKKEPCKLQYLHFDVIAHVKLYLLIFNIYFKSGLFAKPKKSEVSFFFLLVCCITACMLCFPKQILCVCLPNLFWFKPHYFITKWIMSAFHHGCDTSRSQSPYQENSGNVKLITKACF